jgi:hypothetical protein
MFCARGTSSTLRMKSLAHEFMSSPICYFLAGGKPDIAFLLHFGYQFVQHLESADAPDGLRMAREAKISA